MHDDVHEAVRDVARRFADDVVRPAAAALDRDERFPREIHAAMAEAGLFGITVPEALGGAGLDVTAYALVMEELSRGYASIADQCGLVELVAAPLARHGTEAQRAPVADVGLVLARTDPGAGHRKMSIFVVDLHADGVSRGPKESKMGRRASTVGALFFDGVRLPGNALLGEEGRGFHLIALRLGRGRDPHLGRGAAVRRLGLRARRRGRAAVPRREDHADLGGHEPDPAHDHRARAAGEGGAGPSGPHFLQRPNRVLTRTCPRAEGGTP